MNKIIVNLTMVSEKPTGMEKFAIRCAQAVSTLYDVHVAGPIYLKNRFPQLYVTPQRLAVTQKGGSALFRMLFNTVYFIYRKDWIIYTPTHHGILGKKNQIITILDNIPLMHKNQKPIQSLYFGKILPKIIRDSLGIITISNYMKQFLCERFALPQEKIHVVYCGVDEELFQKQNDNSGGNKKGKKPFLLVVGATLPHKNIEEILCNHNLWKDNFYLKVIAPFDEYRMKLEDIAMQLGIEQYVEFYSYVSYADLLSNYQNCAALLYPSLQEGFGIPPLEAMAAGRPAIVSDIKVLREICGDAALYVKLGNRKSWEESFSAIRDSNKMKELIQKGTIRSKLFTWENSKQQLKHALNTILYK